MGEQTAGLGAAEGLHVVRNTFAGEVIEIVGEVGRGQAEVLGCGVNGEISVEAVFFHIFADQLHAVIAIADTHLTDGLANGADQLIQQGCQFADGIKASQLLQHAVCGVEAFMLCHFKQAVERHAQHVKADHPGNGEGRIILGDAIHDVVDAVGGRFCVQLKQMPLEPLQLG